MEGGGSPQAYIQAHVDTFVIIGIFIYLFIYLFYFSCLGLRRYLIPLSRSGEKSIGYTSH